MKCRVTGTSDLGEGWFRVEATAPEIARETRAGQFVQVAVGEEDEPLVRRPFSVYDVLPEPGALGERIQLLYQVVGAGTRWMSRLREGDGVDLLGPLGQPMPTWDPESGNASEIFLVGGGIGVAPLYLYCREALQAGRLNRHRVLLGARHRALLVGLDAFRQVGVHTEVSTDDGSEGFHGNIVELLASLLEERPVEEIAGIGCGPHGMNVALRDFAVERALDFWISLENYMPCGFGACFGCVIRAPSGAKVRYRRVCVEGPAFPAAELPGEL